MLKKIFPFTGSFNGENEIPDLDHVRSHIVNAAITVFTYLILPTIAIVYLRSKDSGFDSKVYFQYGLYLSFFLFALVNKRFSLRVRTYVTLFTIYFASAAGILIYGLTAGGFIGLLTFSILALTLLGRKAALIAFMISLFTVGLIGLAVHTGVVSYNVDFFRLMVSPVSWLSYVFILIFVGGILLFSLERLTGFLIYSNKLLKSRTIELEVINKKFEEEILQRTKTEEELNKYKFHLEKLVEERTGQLADSNELLEKEVKKLKLAEESIRDQLSFVETILKTVPIPIFIKDLQGKYINCNQSFEEISGRNRDKILGSRINDSDKIPDHKVHTRADEELLKTGKVITYQTQFINAQNLLREALVCKAPLVKSDGKITGIIGVFQDITESKTLEKNIQNLLETERQLNKLKTRFISTTSHEFRTPLTAILASADLLEIYGRNWTEEKYKKHTTQIRRSVKYMTELLDDILEISRVESGKAAFNPIMLNIPEVCLEVMEVVKVRATEKHDLCFNYECEENIFKLDEKLIKRILTNLLSNAVKYSPDGGRIELKISKKDQGLLIEVKDQGIGIPEEEMKNLDEPFYRAQNASHIPGTGLGLPIVKKAVEMQGGKLFFESRLGEGSSFFVTIPV